MNITDIINNILSRYKDINMKNSYGETAFFYNPENKLKNGVYFCTIKEKDGENDKSSNLNRNGVYRINFALSQDRFKSLFGEKPKRAKKGGVVDMDFDFTSLNQLIPHPVYAWMSWAAILCPEKDMWESVIPLIDESYNMAVSKFNKKMGVK